MSENQLIVATQRTNETQHDLWRFAVILPFETERGSMGFIMNQSVANIGHRDISQLYQVGTMPNSRIWCGGPTMTERCTVLHSLDYANTDTKTITDHAAITFNTQIIRDINQGRGPKYYKIMLGFCQWEDGQLDAELTRGMWHQVSWHHTAWSSYKRKDKMWRRLLERDAEQDAKSFLNTVFVK